MVFQILIILSFIIAIVEMSNKYSPHLGIDLPLILLFIYDFLTAPLFILDFIFFKIKSIFIPKNKK